MNYGRINFTGDLDALNREPQLATQKRHDFHKAPPEVQSNPGHVCPGCHIIRPPREYAGLGETFRNCANCRGKGKSRETVR